MSARLQILFIIKLCTYNVHKERRCEQPVSWVKVNFEFPVNCLVIQHDRTDAFGLVIADCLLLLLWNKGCRLYRHTTYRTFLKLLLNAPDILTVCNYDDVGGRFESVKQRTERDSHVTQGFRESTKKARCCSYTFFISLVMKIVPVFDTFTQ